MNFLEIVAALDRTLSHEGDLSAYAAQAAMRELTASWKDAIRDGSRPAELLRDIDLVVAKLQECRAALA